MHFHDFRVPIVAPSAYNVIAKARGQLHAVYIVTEYAQGGDLLKLLLGKNVSLGWRFRIQIAKEVSRFFVLHLRMLEFRVDFYATAVSNNGIPVAERR